MPIRVDRILAAAAMAVAGAALAAPSLTAAAAVGAAAPVAIVAAEKFYGDVAQQIGGPEVSVTSILGNPDEDPHLFEASPSVARDIADARIVIYNGLGYDPWIEKLLRATADDGAGHSRTAIAVSALVGAASGGNPHIWYDPATMLALANGLAAELNKADPSHRAEYGTRLGRFRDSLRPIIARIAALRRRFAGTPVTATEPVFGYMFAALGMRVRNQQFQLAVMNNTEPSAADVAAFEDDLRAHRVRLLVYNRQATDPAARRMLAIAKAADVPVVGASETEPPGTSYQRWIAGALDSLDRAMAEQQQRP